MGIQYGHHSPDYPENILYSAGEQWDIRAKDLWLSHSELSQYFGVSQPRIRKG